MLGLLNNNLSKGILTHKHVAYQRPRGGSKKFVQQGRSHFCAQSVLPVREHGKLARTPLAAFFNSPNTTVPPGITPGGTGPETLSTRVSVANLIGIMEYPSRESSNPKFRPTFSLSC